MASAELPDRDSPKSMIVAFIPHDSGRRYSVFDCDFFVGTEVIRT
jgi:hypothetical protein